MTTTKLTLPETSPLRSPEFTFGVATASFQIEGAADQRLPSIWDTFCDTPNKIRDNSTGQDACQHVELWRQDVDLLASLAVDAYRFSVSWPRVMHRDGTINQQGLDFYIQLLDKLQQQGIKAFVTLYHWDLPQYLEDQGGWLNRETAYRFRDYVELVIKAFGDRVYSYATLNEPFCSAFLGYEVGVHAPGLQGKNQGKKAAHHLLLAHGLAMQVLNKYSPGSRNGIVLNFTPCYANSDSQRDIEAAQTADDHFNHWYIKPILDGCYPSLIDSLPAADMPPIEPGDMEIISHPLDYLGINYYTRAIYQADELHEFVELKPQRVPLTDMGWEIYPQGFLDLLLSLDQTYQLPPVYITENGAAMNDRLVDGEVLDHDRVEYFQHHLNAVDLAIRQGVNIQGYFAWSLMDNFEWAEGYAKRFGLVFVDYQSQQRTVKASGLAYRDFIGQRQV